MDEHSKHITASVIHQLNADVLCLQEVEGGHVLTSYRDHFLYDMKYVQPAFHPAFR